MAAATVATLNVVLRVAYNSADLQVTAAVFDIPSASGEPVIYRDAGCAGCHEVPVPLGNV